MSGLTRIHAVGTLTVMALPPVDLTVDRGEWVALRGPSGSGKSTLLHLVAGLDRPTAGTVDVMGARLADLDSEELARWRAANVGLVFQDPHLIPGLTALENVMLARVPHERDRGLADRARDMLGAVGLADRIDFPPSRLSGGERQRVGIARALVGRPSLLLADEPTGNLDAASTASILDLLGRLRADLDLTMLVATHDPIVSQHSDRDHRLRDG